ncbi:MAG TPA: cytidine/deoxycytidylate deaminase family protein [Bellilinea sp.]|nr:cytidine/deoxycytidylate deaminase family protein [Bellilinea sp.]
MRPSWDTYFMQIARDVAARSTCDRAFVGAVLVRDKHIIATGYNGSPAGLPHCDETGHLMVEGHCVRTVHAEVNSIVQAAVFGLVTEGATCYVTHFPCLNCTKTLINAHIKRLVYDTSYRMDPIAVEFLSTAGIEVVAYQPEPKEA